MEGVDRKKMIIGAVAISLAGVLWGIDGILLTPRLHTLKPSFVVFMTHAIPFALMNIFFWGSYKSLKQLKQKELIALFLVALFGGAIGTLSIVKALFLVNFQKLSAVVLLQKMQPIFAIILAGIFLKERVGRSFIFWAALAIVSGYFVTFGLNIPDFQTDRNTLLASGYALLAAFSFGSSTVFSKMALKNVSFKTATFLRYGFTTVIMAIVVTLTGNWEQFSIVTTQNWIIFAIIAVTTGAGAIFLFYYGLRRVRAVVATICELMFPLTAILLDYYFNDLYFSPVQIVAAALMLFSIISLNLSRQVKK